MTLIKSISGIRGTIGGAPGDTLNPLDIVKFTSAYATVIRRSRPEGSNKVIVGRDARISGEMVRSVVCGTLMGMGFDVVDIGLASTPTTEVAVTMEGADGGIILTASHNPRQWNALKLLDHRGEFLSAKAGEQVLSIAEAEDFAYADVDHVGSYRQESYDERHVRLVTDLDLVDCEAIRKAKFRVAFDAVNSVGGIILPKLFDALGIEQVSGLFAEPTGDFQHNPEPLEQNLGSIKALMQEGNHDIGFVVDPDVDRLALFCEDGTMYGEEYTLVTAADWVLQHTPGNTVSNLSSTRALSDVTHRFPGCQYAAAAVGEVNVVEKMREVGAVIGGEGNGGVIYPAAHPGRDALVGIALILTYMAKRQLSASALRATYPRYAIAKNRIDLTPGTDVDAILLRLKEHFAGERITDTDGVKIDFPTSWVHLRKSNTEPIIRIYSEAATIDEANALAQTVMNVMRSMA